MKKTSFILLFAVFTFMSCKKDVGKAPETASQTTPTTTPTNTNVPFVEYRDSFLGNYAGIYTSFNYTVYNDGVGGFYELRDTVLIADTLSTVTNSTFSNTMVAVSFPLGNYGVLSSGSFTYQAPPSTPSSSGKTLAYNIKFRNDSLFLTSYVEKMLMYRTKHAYYTKSFVGKKQ